MRRPDIDKILYTQLIIARMGEKELMNWWNTDIAYEMGGADFLKRLIGDTLAPLAAGEAILKAAYLKDSKLIDDMPDNQKVYTLFRPEPEVHMAVEERLRYFKRYPETLPEEISQILDPKKEWKPDELADLIQPEHDIESTGSSFGKEIEKMVGQGMPDIMINLASLIKRHEKGRYILCYYRET
ncbi:MAG: BREX-6 system BrxE protein [Desulfamplus sp.]|nr:BREX-6 system BrxE protein [Desulfamplus sp.]